MEFRNFKFKKVLTISLLEHFERKEIWNSKFETWNQPFSSFWYHHHFRSLDSKFHYIFFIKSSKNLVLTPMSSISISFIKLIKLITNVYLGCIGIILILIFCSWKAIMHLHLDRWTHFWLIMSQKFLIRSTIDKNYFENLNESVIDWMMLFPVFWDFH